MTESRKGEIAILTQVVLWGAFPVITVGIYSQLPPFLTLSLSSLFAAFVFGLIIAYKKLWKELFLQEALKYSLIMTLINGVAYYCLFFAALKYTSPGNAALIALSENFTNFVFFHLFLKEEYSLKEVLGYSFTVVGAFIVLFSGFSHDKIGNILLVIASTIAPLGNYYLRKARRLISSVSIMFIRTLLVSLIVFFVALIFREDFSILLNLSTKNWFFLFLNGVLILGFSKVLWAEGTHRISVSKALALTNISPVFTILFAYFILRQSPSLRQLISIPFLIFGVCILLKKNPFTTTADG